MINGKQKTDQAAGMRQANETAKCVSPGEGVRSEQEHLRLARVNPDFFSVLGVAPVIGRTFAPQELVPGSQAVLISHAYWRSRFGGDAGVLQRSVRVYGNTWPIVGVLPPGFEFPGETHLWFPEAAMPDRRTGLNFRAIARLKPEISLEQAQAEMTAIAARLEQAYPDANKGHSVGLTRLQDEVVGDVRPTLYLLWGVVGMVLLIACLFRRLASARGTSMFGTPRVPLRLTPQ